MKKLTVSSTKAAKVVANEPQRQTDDPYSVHLNGTSVNSHWQTSNVLNGKMFAVPTQLKNRDEIIIKGNITDGMLDIALRPDGNEYNIVCQVNAVLPENGQPHDQIQLRSTQNGNHVTHKDDLATNYFYDQTFEASFQISDSYITINMGGSTLGNISLEHSLDNIRYISVKGEVKELNFLFN